MNHRDFISALCTLRSSLCFMQEATVHTPLQPRMHCYASTPRISNSPERFHPQCSVRSLLVIAHTHSPPRHGHCLGAECMRAHLPSEARCLPSCMSCFNPRYSRVSSLFSCYVSCSSSLCSVLVHWMFNVALLQPLPTPSNALRPYPVCLSSLLPACSLVLMVHGPRTTDHGSQAQSTLAVHGLLSTSTTEQGLHLANRPPRTRA